MRSPKKLTLFLLLFLALLAYFLWPRGKSPLPREYEIIDLGTPPGTQIIIPPLYLDEKGQVAGKFMTQKGRMSFYHVFVWTEETGIKTFDMGSETDLAEGESIDGETLVEDSSGEVCLTLEGLQICVSALPLDGTAVRKINRAGQYVWGKAMTEWEKKLLPDDSRQKTPVAPWGNKQRFAAAVNDRGMIVGNLARGISYATATFHAFVWSATEGLVDLNPNDGLSYGAHDINENGDVVGQVSSIKEGFSVILWFADGSSKDLHIPLRPFFGFNATINNNGQIVGAFDSTALGKKFVNWLYERLTGRNVAFKGQYYGYGNAGKRGPIGKMLERWGNRLPTNQDESAFLWEKGEMYELNDFLPDDSEWKDLWYATDINDRGQIVGIGHKKGGIPIETRACLMTPIEPGAKADN